VINAALEVEPEYGRDGKLLKRKWSVGGIAIWRVVVLILCLSCHQPVTLPDSVSSWLSRAKEAQAPVIPRPGSKRRGAGGRRPRVKPRSMVGSGAGAPRRNSVPLGWAVPPKWRPSFARIRCLERLHDIADHGGHRGEYLTFRVIRKLHAARRQIHHPVKLFPSKV
jgi:hypothetical protein